MIDTSIFGQLYQQYPDIYGKCISGYADFEYGVITAFNHCWAHEHNALTTPYGIIFSDNERLSQQLGPNSFKLAESIACVNWIRLRKYNSDNIYVTSYGDILYRDENLTLSVISVKNISEWGTNITIIPLEVYYRLGLYNYNIETVHNTVDLALSCFHDCFDYLHADNPSQYVLLEMYLIAISDNDFVTMNDPYSSGYQFTIDYLDSL